MNLPEQSEEFKARVLDKLRVYCDTKIWPFDFDQFTKWLGNFDCKTEEYLALHLLDSLIVRSNDMAIASFEKLFNSSLRQECIRTNIIANMPLKSWKEKLKHGYLAKNIKFMPVTMGEDGESGHVVYRMLHQFLETNKYQYNPDQENSGLKAIVLVDDVLGSGEQFLEFAAEFKLEEKITQYQIIYCPLMACMSGLEVLKQKFPSLIVIPAEFIPVNQHLFNEPLSNHFQRDLSNTKAEVKAFLMKMNQKYAPKMDHWLGRNEASLCLAFQWGCPNQSFALLYMNRSVYREHWKQLFQRRSA